MKNYAFIKDNIVVNIAVFEDDITEDILQIFKEQHNADLVILTDKNAFIGGDYIEGQFRSACPFSSWSWDKIEKEWIAPIPMPKDDKFYYWSEEIQNWVVVSSY
tara:strand:- start:1174 stop:1485 length:312 start_codon:yes stop_codon:yes gene_type:complete